MFDSIPVAAALGLFVAMSTLACKRPTPPASSTTRLGMTFVAIPAGSFRMGDDSHRDEQPVHAVTFKAPFWLQQTELTQKQWVAVMKTRPWKNAPRVLEGDDFPAVHFTWPEAQELIKKLNEIDPGHDYRLPSEAEWEYACRADSTGLREPLSEVAWFDGNASRVGVDHAQPVGRRKPNAWGLFDMYGNVWEWVGDSYFDSYVGAPSDGTARRSTEFDSHTYRGGSYRNADRFARCSARAGLDEEDHTDNIGVRILMQKP
jgi:formylglycine-generating enzyme required for sulfatase activity